MTQNDVIDLFNCVVTTKNHILDTPLISHELLGVGVVTNFTPTLAQIKVLKEYFKPLDMKTLFTKEERLTQPVENLIIKQFMHYIEVYGLDSPGLFNLEVSTGTIVPFTYVKGIDVYELEEKVQKLLYSNAPIKDTAQLMRIVEMFNIDYDVKDIKNNEMRVRMFRPGTDKFDNGDDAVRFLCLAATGDTLLIKSKEVINAVKEKNFKPDFFLDHGDVLATVFNRHKKLILAAKNKRTANVINWIARKSKTRHVPVRESIAKTFINKALHYPMWDASGALDFVTLRDKFKYLNLLEQKKVGSGVVSYKIRNGKVFTKLDKWIYALPEIGRVQGIVLESVKTELAQLKSKSILLDPNVDYGLPISRKQAVGRLPFGTKVNVRGNEISSGMYWENKGGARDLDLSTVDAEGNRVGWGGYGGYEGEGIIFSGDVTDARSGAMEFMTSKKGEYGLFVNIFAGELGSKMELVVGPSSTSKKRWMDNAIIREKHELNSHGCVLGFVKDKTYVVYSGRLGRSRVSGPNPIVNESKADFWTLKRLFDTINIDYDVEPKEGVEYDHDLSYDSFSFDKLEEVITTAA